MTCDKNRPKDAGAVLRLFDVPRPAFLNTGFLGGLLTCIAALWSLSCDNEGPGEPPPEEGQVSCSEDADCAHWFLCEAGVCVEMTCPTIYEPVCGEDGTTYSNTCEAEAARASISAEGECPPAVLDMTDTQALAEQAMAAEGVDLAPSGLWSLGTHNELPEVATFSPFSHEVGTPALGVFVNGVYYPELVDGANAIVAREGWASAESEAREQLGRLVVRQLFFNNHSVAWRDQPHEEAIDVHTTEDGTVTVTVRAHAGSDQELPPALFMATITPEGIFRSPFASPMSLELSAGSQVGWSGSGPVGTYEGFIGTPLVDFIVPTPGLVARVTVESEARRVAVNVTGPRAVWYDAVTDAGADEPHVYRPGRYHITLFDANAEDSSEVEVVLSITSEDGTWVPDLAFPDVATPQVALGQLHPDPDHRPTFGLGELRNLGGSQPADIFGEGCAGYTSTEPAMVLKVETEGLYNISIRTDDAVAMALTGTGMGIRCEPIDGGGAWAEERLLVGSYGVWLIAAEAGAGAQGTGQVTAAFRWEE